MMANSEILKSPHLRFLVVDDASTIRLVIRALLKGLGWANVTEAENGMKALECLKSNIATGHAIDFVITDWKMPAMDGLALLREIRADKELKHLPVLMISAEAEGRHVTTLANGWADGYLSKFLLTSTALKEALETIWGKHCESVGNS